MPQGAHIETIEGRRTLVVERTPPLPPKLDKLMAELYQVTLRQDIRPGGTSVQCEQLRTHRFAAIREGRHFGTDGVIRDLRLEMCRDCGAVAVHDISYDRMPGLTHGRRGPTRKDHILGWYTGARRNQQEYL